MPDQPPLMPLSNYEQLLSDLKMRIQTAQVKAALAVNTELVLLYWQIGQDILMRQQQAGWGKGVIGRLSKDLQREFPEIKGFSPRNLGYMKAFAAAWPDEQFLHQLGAKIPWKHNCILLDKVKDPEARLWYIQQTIQNGWSRNVLVLQIESDLYTRQGGAITNFERTLPQPQSDLAQQLIKDPYNFDFLTLSNAAHERELEAALVTHMRDFLLELGVGFAFMGSQYPLSVDGKEYRLDLLFYHTHLRCYVVIDLKMGEFEPEFTGKMNFYVSAVDDMLRRGDDQPTIGLVLCKSKQKTTAEYALRNLNTPIAVSTHQMKAALSASLPTPEQLAMELDTAVSELEAEATPTAEKNEEGG